MVIAGGKKKDKRVWQMAVVRHTLQHGGVQGHGVWLHVPCPITAIPQ